MKTLYLLRHAKAEPASASTEDVDRALSVRGRESCDFIGNYMRSEHYAPDYAWCSVARRTQETFKRVMDAARLAPEHVIEKRIYLASSETIIALIRQTPDSADTVMVVGHNPGMHHVAMDLAVAQDNETYHALRLKYPTGALTVLRFAVERWEDIRQGQGELADFMSPP